MVQVVLIDQRYEVITRGWVEWYQERGQNWWSDGRWSVVMWQVRTESSPKKAEYYIWSIRFGSYDTGGEMTTTKQHKDN